MTQAEIDKICWQYLKQSLLMIASLSFIALLVMRILMLDSILTPLVISVIFALIVEIADIRIWRRVILSNSENLPTFFMSVSGFRMLAGIGVMFVYYLALDGASFKVPFIVFIAFYFMLLIHHSLFFSIKRKHKH